MKIYINQLRRIFSSDEVNIDIVSREIMNDYPRKQLGYQTPHDLFIREFHKERKGEPVAEPVSA